ncbi:MAG: large-conductance mechanosensitive channel protein MscL [Clostridia bacterium]|nr:large-conductance mechanosensitive channel protein MscL [Clostridia bacterium]
MIKEFKEFISKGNVIDMAVGVIIGGAFGKIVTSLVNDIIMPFFSWVFGGSGIENLKYVYQLADEENGIAEGAINYGTFISTVVDFLLIALSIFIFVKIVAGVRKKFEKKKEEAPEEPKGPTTEELLAEIRDLLSEKK